MKLYRFSPIKNEEELLDAIRHVHFSCYKLCKQSFGDYKRNSGNIGIFCHYDDEYSALISLRKTMTEPSENPEQKYFALHTPIVIASENGVPEAIYTHLYIRKPDPYRHHVGDVDFSVRQEIYHELKTEVSEAPGIRGARIFDRKDLDMIELFDPNIDALAYVSSEEMTEAVRVKIIVPV